MNLHKLILKENNCYKAGKKIIPRGVMVHSTGANNPNLKRYVGPDDGLLGKNIYNNHWNTPQPGGQNICCHGFIGKLADGTIATYQTLPWDCRGWHCASGKNGSGNDTHIGIEICEDALTDPKYFHAVYMEMVELCAYLCKMYKLDPAADGVVICHAEGHRRGIASNHGDVLHWWPKFGKNMDSFRADVLKAMGKSPVKDNHTETKALYRVQCGAFSKKANADALAAELKSKGYETFIVKVNKLYKVQIGAFAVKANADNMAAELKQAGYTVFVTDTSRLAASSTSTDDV